MTPEEFAEACRTKPETVFTEGGCYWFYELMKSKFPQAEAWGCINEKYVAHVVVRINGKFYDIHGEQTAESLKELYVWDLKPFEEIHHERAKNFSFP